MTATAVAARERPILFSAPMVKAILAGTKTQTRRVVSDATSRGNVKPSRCDLSRAFVDPGPSPAGNPGPYLKAPVVKPEDVGIVERIYPPYFVGDRLWVRESWNIGRPALTSGPNAGAGFVPKWLPNDGMTVEQYRDHYDDHKLVYAASWDGPDVPPMRPSIHMHRWASRITLEITDVRVERLNAITSADARAEGCVPSLRESETDAFHNLWDSINASRGYSWESNPWVYAISFHRVTP